MLGVNLTRIRPNYYAQHVAMVSLCRWAGGISLRSQMPCGLRNHNRRAYTFNPQHRWTYFRGRVITTPIQIIGQERGIHLREDNKRTNASTDAIPANPWAHNGVSILLHLFVLNLFWSNYRFTGRWKKYTEFQRHYNQFCQMLPSYIIQIQYNNRNWPW